MALINFYPVDEAKVGFEADQGILRELQAKYSFYAPNYKYDKRYKLGYWDGKISPINRKDKTIPKGLMSEIHSYLKAEGVDYNDEVEYFQGPKLTDVQITEFFKKIKGPFEPHKPQIDAFEDCISKGRNIILAPTSMGKSYAIHGLNAYYKLCKKRVLIIIHRAQLVLQLKSNFEDEYNSKGLYTTSTIYDDDNRTDVVITTWQSIKDAPADWLNEFDVIIGDEVHRFKSKIITEILGRASKVGFRHGFTATLDNNSEVDALTLQGLFGPPKQVITLKEQIAKGISAKPNVYVIVIKYSNEIRKELRRQIAEMKKQGQETPDFRVESGFLENLEERTALITQIANSLRGNTLVAFKNESHGKDLHRLISESSGFETFFVNGKVSKTKRFDIQKRIVTLNDSVSTVSFGTFAEGINIPNLNNLIIASQVKSAITVPQLVGRMIRLTDGKTDATIIDICDDLSHAGNDNIFLRHFKTRMKFYLKNQFNIKQKVITIG